MVTIWANEKEGKKERKKWREKKEQKRQTNRKERKKERQDKERAYSVTAAETITVSKKELENDFLKIIGKPQPVCIV